MWHCIPLVATMEVKAVELANRNHGEVNYQILYNLSFLMTILENIHRATTNNLRLHGYEVEEIEELVMEAGQVDFCKRDWLLLCGGGRGILVHNADVEDGGVCRSSFGDIVSSICAMARSFIGLSFQLIDEVHTKLCT